MNTRRQLWVLGALISATALPALAAPHTLTNGPGDGTLSVGVDGYGSFGSATGAAETAPAVYDPIGAGIPASTTFESWLAIGSGGARTMLSTETIALAPTVTGSTTLGSSTFTGPAGFTGLLFSLTQKLDPLFTGVTQTGSIVTQTYAITNTTAAPISFELIRYLDGDLLFDGSLVDGGGRIISGALEILFETDSATGSAASTTFVGITGEGGSILAASRYEIDSYLGLRSRILAGTALDNIVTLDGGDLDEFIDAGSGYDVTLALSNIFTLGGGATDTYVTRTIFGSGSPETVSVVPTPSAVLAGVVLLGGLVVRRIRR